MKATPGLKNSRLRLLENGDLIEELILEYNKVIIKFEDSFELGTPSFQEEEVLVYVFELSVSVS